MEYDLVALGNGGDRYNVLLNQGNKYEAERRSIYREDIQCQSRQVKVHVRANENKHLLERHTVTHEL